MHRVAGFFILASALAAQPQPGNPFDTQMQAYWTTQRDGTCQESAAARTGLRNTLDTITPTDQRFVGAVESVAQLYQSGGRALEARVIVERALTRMGTGGSAARATLLIHLADLWEQDRNLLQAVSYREQAVAILEKLPPAATQPEAPMQRTGVAYASRAVISARPVMINGPMMGGVYNGSFGSAGSFAAVPNLQYPYQRLAQTYRQLGRPDKVAEVNAKVAALLKDNQAALASWYQSEGRSEDAAALYKKLAEQPGDPQQRASAWENLAGVYQNQQQLTQAAAAMRSAIAAVDSAGGSDTANRAIWMRQRLAMILNQAGDTKGADQVFAQLLSEQGSNLQVINAYANHLSTTKRAGEAEAMLKQYLAAHPDLEPHEQANLLFQLANAARVSGQSDKAEEYQRAAAEKAGNVSSSAPDNGVGRVLQVLSEAQRDAMAGKLDQAYELALSVIASSDTRSGRSELIAMQTGSIAQRLGSSENPERGVQLFRRIADLAANCAAANLQPVVQVRREYASFLMNRQRWNDAQDAIQSFRDAVIEGSGKQSGALTEPLRMEVELANRRGDHEQAAVSAEALLALEESLSGKTSEPYLEALQNLAAQIDGGGESRRAAGLLLQALRISDLVYPAADIRRAFVRTRVASLLARQGQFDDAERLVTEAIEIGTSAQPSNVDGFRSQLAEIRRMREVGTQKGGRWFTRP